MTDPALPPEQEAVRRLLAEARHDGPTPPEVVARLDETLASLRAERVPEQVSEQASEQASGARPATPGADGPTASVIDLGARRRRLAGMALLAAAAVVVAGVGLGQVLPTGPDDSGGSATSADSSTGRDFEGQSSDDDGGADAGGQGGSSQLAPESQKSVAPFAGTPTVSAGDPALEDDLLDARSAAGPAATESGVPEAYAACDLPRLGRGRVVTAEVDGRTGLIVFRRPDGAAQQVELYVCGTPEPVRTLTLPAP